MDKTNWNKIRNDFPILKQSINNKPLIYFDNGATTQKPIQVIDSIVKLYKEYNANIHRGLYSLSEKTTFKYQESKEIIAKFLNISSYKNIIYTKNATEGFNMVSKMLEDRIKKDDEILVSITEHHSNLLPWINIAKKKSAIIKYIDIDSEGNIDLTDLKNKITSKTKILAITHVSNVLGTINPIKEIIKIARDNNIITVIDGAQAVGHIKVDLKNINPDFYIFSGHKMLAPTGIGVVYINDRIINELEPVFFGGDMVLSVSKTEIVYNDIPWKFEAGTSNFEGAIAFGEAVKYIESIGIETIEQRCQDLYKYLLKRISELEDIKIYGNSKDKVSIMSFTYNDIHPHDIAALLARDNICIRAGHHCANPLIDELGVNALSRVSLYFYNTKEEIDIFINSLKNIKKILKK